MRSISPGGTRASIAKAAAARAANAIASTKPSRHHHPLRSIATPLQRSGRFIHDRHSVARLNSRRIVRRRLKLGQDGPFKIDAQTQAESRRPGRSGRLIAKLIRALIRLDPATRSRRRHHPNTAGSAARTSAESQLWTRFRPTRPQHLVVALLLKWNFYTKSSNRFTSCRTRLNLLVHLAGRKRLADAVASELGAGGPPKSCLRWIGDRGN